MSTAAIEAIETATRHWLTRAVIGLNLCPFAKAVYVKRQIRYVVSEAQTAEDVIGDLEQALRVLADADPEVVDTTLVIVPNALADFLDYNDCLYLAERLLKRMRLVGELQIASFHPDYQFEGTAPDDIENYTNRSPYPIFHLLREDSIERAVAAFPDASDIYERNQATMRRLGHEGWRKWMRKEMPEAGDGTS
ncbi:peptidase [Pandoraea terrae]|uniref:Peptidase n=2 Tax=Pandoraea terrae TaxID=1537710 RepID=A0A5E4XHD2_9BURK|nr:peptidase [Pandoraea terrae]